MDTCWRHQFRRVVCTACGVFRFRIVPSETPHGADRRAGAASAEAAWPARRATAGAVADGDDSGGVAAGRDVEPAEVVGCVAGIQRVFDLSRPAARDERRADVGTVAPHGGTG